MNKINIKQFGIILLCFVISITFYSCSPNFRYISKKFDAEYIIDSTFKESSDLDYEVKDINKDGSIIIKTYTKDSVLIGVENYSKYIEKSNDEKETILTGESNFFYEEGNTKEILNYNKSGKLEGNLLTYYPTGIIKRNDYYHNDSLITGKCFDSTGKEVSYFPYEINPAVDLKMLSECVKYPFQLKVNEIEEKCILKLLLSKQGKILIIKYDEGNSPEFIKESIRCILQTKFAPAYQDGEPISCWVNIPVTFRLLDK